MAAVQVYWYVIIDWTHVGVSLKKLSITPIEKSELMNIKPTIHTRYDGVLINKTIDMSPIDPRTLRSLLRAHTTIQSMEEVLAQDNANVLDLFY